MNTELSFVGELSLWMYSTRNFSSIRIMLKYQITNLFFYLYNTNNLLKTDGKEKSTPLQLA